MVGYFYIVPAAQEQARRKLAVDDVINDNGDISYVHIAPNASRRIKKLRLVQSLALHPKSFAEDCYIMSPRSGAGLQALIPRPLLSDTKSLLGDRLSDELSPSMDFTPHQHQYRLFFADTLKHSEVPKEFRPDLIGHGGEPETTERYCNPLSIARQLRR